MVAKITISFKSLDQILPANSLKHVLLVLRLYGITVNCAEVVPTFVPPTYTSTVSVY